MSRGRRCRTGAVAAAWLAATGCSGGLIGQAPAAERPYVVTAIDYHFHDAHPSRPIRLDRAVTFSSQARNIHNVTIPGTDYARDLRPGERITIDPIGSLLPEPGRYRFFCAYHPDRGMAGVLVVVAAGGG